MADDYSGGDDYPMDDDEEMDSPLGAAFSGAAPPGALAQASDATQNQPVAPTGSSRDYGESEILDKMQANADTAKQALEAAKQRLLAQQVSPAEKFLALGAALGAPTRSGRIGETMANVGNTVSGYLEKQRELEAQKNQGLLGLDQALGTTDQGVLQAKLQLANMKRQAQTQMDLRTLNALAANERIRYEQEQENNRNKARIDAANARAGYRPDGTIDPKFDSIVEAIHDYRMAPYVGASARSGRGMAIMDELYRRYPDYDATSYPAKAAALKSLMSGKDGQTIDQGNTSIQHITQLKGLFDALQNGDIQFINRARQAYQEATGNPAPTNAKVVADMAAGEVNKIVTGAPGAQEDRDLSRAAVQLRGSPEQQRQALDQIIGLMAGRLNSVRNRFQQAKLGNTFDNMLLPETKAALAAHGFTGGTPSNSGQASERSSIPAAARQKLKEGSNTKFSNGQVWTLRNGQPVQVQ